MWENTKQVRGKRGAEDRKRTQSDRTQYERRFRLDTRCSGGRDAAEEENMRMFVGNMQADETRDLTELPVRGSRANSDQFRPIPVSVTLRHPVKKLVW